jgi:hypothetical protein
MHKVGLIKECLQYSFLSHSMGFYSFRYGILKRKMCLYKYRNHYLLNKSLSSHALFGKEVGSDSKVGFLFPTYIFLLISHYKSVSDVGIQRAVRAKLNM